MNKKNLHSINDYADQSIYITVSEIWRTSNRIFLFSFFFSTKKSVYQKTINDVSITHRHQIAHD